MRLFPLAGVLLFACGGATPVGTWKLSAMVTTSGPSGPVMRDSTTLFKLTATAWQVAGCDVPLTMSGQVLELSTASHSCMMESNEDVPFADATGYQWSSGHVLFVKEARFQTEKDRLAIDLSLQLRTNPQDPAVGDLIDIHTGEGKGAVRVR